MCRAKKDAADKQAPTEAAAAAKAAKAPSSSTLKPKQRRRSGMDKTEKDVQHVLYKVIGQVSLKNSSLLLLVNSTSALPHAYSHNAGAIVCVTRPTNPLV